MKSAETEAPAAQPKRPEPAPAEREGVAGAYAPAVSVAAAAAGGTLPPGRAGAAAVVRMQRTLGNAHVQRVLAQRAPAGPAPVSADVADSIAAARGGGAALEDGVREEMEGALGADFSGVRVHHDARADTLSRALSARAFATGPDLFFRSGEFSPSSPGGRKLLAHELTHVVQQGGSAAPVQRSLVVGDPDDAQEREAERVAEAVSSASPAPAPPAAPPTPPVVRRAPAEPTAAEAHVVPSLTVSLSGFTFHMPPGSRFRAGSRREQLMAAILRRIVGAQYTPGLEDLIIKMYGPDVRYTGTMSQTAGPAREGEGMGRVTFSVHRARELLTFVEQLEMRADVTPEQRAILDTGVDADRAWRSIRAANAHPSIRLPAWYTRTLFERELAQFGDAFSPFRKALSAVDKGEKDADAKATAALGDLVARLRATAAILETIRDDVALAAHKEAGPVYRSLWSSAPAGAAAPTALASSEEASLFLRYTRGRDALASRAAADHDARVTLLVDFAYFRGKLRTGTGDEKLLEHPETPHVAPYESTLAAAPALVAPLYETALGSDRRFVMSLKFPTLVEAFTSFRFVWELVPVPLGGIPAPKEAAAPASAPAPAPGSALPAAPPPPAPTAAPSPAAAPTPAAAEPASTPAPASTPTPGSVSPAPVPASDVGAQFTPPEPLASVPPPAAPAAPAAPTSGIPAPATTVDVGKAREAIDTLKAGGAAKAGPGARVTSGELARTRFGRATDYAAEDINRIVGDLGPVGLGTANLVGSGIMLKYLGAGIRLGVDLLSTNERGNRSEQVVTFNRPGLFLLRCAAWPIQAADPKAARAPSVAYHPVLVRPAEEMAAAATHALVERQAGERALRDEVSALAAAPALPDGVRAILERMESDLRLADMPLSFVLEQRKIEAEATAKTLPEASPERKQLDEEVKKLTELLRIQKARGLKATGRLPATFVSDLGHTIPLEMEIETTLLSDERWEAHVSDLTTIDSGRDRATGKDARTAARAAVHRVLSGTQGYGRGWVSFEFHKQIESVRIDASVGQILTEAVENATMVLSLAAVAAAPFTGGATLTLLMPIGLVGAVPSAYRLLTRSQAETLRAWDANTAMDVLNIVGAAVGVGQAAAAARTAQLAAAGLRPSMALVRVGRGVMLIGLASDVGSVVLFGAQLWEQLRALSSLPPGEAQAQLMIILGNALLQAGIVGGDVMARKGLEARRAASEAKALAAQAGVPPHAATGGTPPASGATPPAHAGGDPAALPADRSAPGAPPHAAGDASAAGKPPAAGAAPAPASGAPAKPGGAEPLHEALAREGVRRDIAEPPLKGALGAGITPHSTFASGIPDWETAYAKYNQALQEAPGHEVGIFRSHKDGTYAVRVGDEWSVRAPGADGGPWQGLLHYHHNATAAERFYLPAPADFGELIERYGHTGGPVREFMEYTIPGVGRGRTEYGIDPSAPQPFYVTAHLPDGSTNTVRFAHDGAFTAYWQSHTVVAPPGSALHAKLTADVQALLKGVREARDPSRRTMAGTAPPASGPGAPAHPDPNASAAPDPHAASDAPTTSDAPAAPDPAAGTPDPAAGAAPAPPRRRIIVPSPAAPPAPAAPKKRTPKAAPAAPGGTTAPAAPARSGGRKPAAAATASGGPLLHADGAPTPEGIAWLKRNFKRYRGLSDDAVVEKFASEWRGDDLESLVREEMRRAYRGVTTPGVHLITAGHGGFTGEPPLTDVVKAIDTAMKQAGRAGVSNQQLLNLRPDDIIGLLNPRGGAIDPALQAEARRLSTHPDRAIRDEWERFYTGQRGGKGGGGETSPFSFGVIGNKRPDAVELILPDNRLIVTDITRLYGHPVHNFKTLFYVVLLRRLTGLNVEGVEYRSLFQQTHVP